MKQYVLGFAFNCDDEVLMIEKKKPEWQAGLLNGIGGKIEADDLSPENAMVREFYEETGVKTLISDWRKVAIMSGDDWEVQVYASYDSIDILSAKTTTEEPIVVIRLEAVILGQRNNFLSNVPWLLGMCLDEDARQGRRVFNVEYADAVKKKVDPIIGLEKLQDYFKQFDKPCDVCGNLRSESPSCVRYTCPYRDIWPDRTVVVD